MSLLERAAGDLRVSGRTVALLDGAPPLLAELLEAAGATVTTGEAEAIAGAAGVRVERNGAEAVRVDGEPAALLAEERGEVLVTAVLDATNLLLAGKAVVVGRYDHAGRGAARRARGLGARVTVVPDDARTAYAAWRDAYRVAPAAAACGDADLVLLPAGLPLAELPEGAIVGADEPGALGLDDAPREAVRERVEAVTLPGGRRVDVADLSTAEPPREVRELEAAFVAVAVELVLRDGAGDRLRELPADQVARVVRWRLEARGVAF